MTSHPEASGFPEEVRIPIEDNLDLHHFRPSDVGSLVPEYLIECRKRGLLAVRIVHGKGTGSQREQVHAILSQLDGVQDFTIAGTGSGGWGATWVYLQPESVTRR
jgi:DNA-nicking Smr family endonuclease